MAVNAHSSPDTQSPLPADWRTEPLGSLIDSADYGSSTKSSERGAVPVLRMGNLLDGKILWDDLVYTSDEREVSRYLLQPGDVLFNRTNTLELVGKTSLFTETAQAIFAGYLVRIRTNRRKLDPRYLTYVLNTRAAKQYGRMVVSVAVGQANINASKLKTYPIPLPPTQPEQVAIADALSDVDGLIGALDRLIAKKRDLKQAAMQQLLTGRTRLPGFKGKWETAALRKIIAIPVTDGPHMTPVFLPDGVPFLSVNNLVDGKVSVHGLRHVSRKDHVEFSRKCRPIRGDILLGKAASVGLVALVNFDWEFNVWSPIAVIRVSSQHVPAFFYYALQARSVINQIKLFTNSSSQGNIGMGDIESLVFSFPTRDEQAAIAQVLTDMDAEIAGLESRRDKTLLLKQGMMQELLTGRTRLVDSLTTTGDK